MLLSRATTITSRSSINLLQLWSAARRQRRPHSGRLSDLTPAERWTSTPAEGFCSSLSLWGDMSRRFDCILRNVALAILSVVVVVAVPSAEPRRAEPLFLDQFEGPDRLVANDSEYWANLDAQSPTGGERP